MILSSQRVPNSGVHLGNNLRCYRLLPRGHCLERRWARPAARAQAGEGDGDGDQSVQEALVRTVRLEISKERIREQVEEDSDRLRLAAAKVRPLLTYPNLRLFNL